LFHTSVLGIFLRFLFALRFTINTLVHIYLLQYYELSKTYCYYSWWK